MAKWPTAVTTQNDAAINGWQHTLCQALLQTLLKDVLGQVNTNENHA